MNGFVELEVEVGVRVLNSSSRGATVLTNWFHHQPFPAGRSYQQGARLLPAPPMMWLLVVLSTSAFAEPPRLEAPPAIETTPITPAQQRVETPSVPNTHVEVRHVFGMNFARRVDGSLFYINGELELGARFFLGPLPEDPTRHRQIVAFLTRPSSIDVSVGLAAVPSVVSRLFLTRSTALLVGLEVPGWQPVSLRPRLGVLQYLGPSVLVEAQAALGIVVQQPDAHIVEVALGTSFLAGGRWLPSIVAGYGWGARLRSNAVTLTINNRFFVTPRLALRLDLTGGVISPVEVVVAVTPAFVVEQRTALHFAARGAGDWEWNRWITTALTFALTWTRNGESAPLWGVGPGFDVRVRF